MPLPNDPRLFGRAWVTPDAPVIGGAWGTWCVTYEVGAYAYDERARLKIAWRFASDWAKPQFGDPGAANYATVRIDSRSEGAVPSLTYEPRGHAIQLAQSLLAYERLHRGVPTEAPAPAGSVGAR